MHRFYLQRTHLNQGGYDTWKRYWGTGAPLYWYFCGDCNDPKCPVEGHIRAEDRKHARQQLEAAYPGSTFYRR